MYNLITLLYSENLHNTINQLYFNLKNKISKKKKIKPKEGVRLLLPVDAVLQEGAGFQFPFLACELAGGRDCILRIFVTL